MSPLHAHLHCNSWMRVVSVYKEIVVRKIFYIGDVARPAESWESARLAGKLYAERINMILVNVCISKLNDKLMGHRICDAGDHVGEQGVRRDVKRNSKAQVRGALIHEAR